MKADNKISFGNIYNVTAYVQNHTLINRGITTIGGSTIPQCIMSNNKDEARERATMGGIYFIASYLTPILLIPLYNKHFLKNKGIINSIDSIGKRIIEVPKKYLTPDADLKKGLELTAEIFNKKFKTNKYTRVFDKIYRKYSDPNRLKEDLLKVHEKILMTDFITTAAMWSAIPWVATEMTEHKTKRKDFSAGFKLKKENTNNNEISKTNKILLNVLLAVIPGVIFAKAVTKGLSLKNSEVNKNIFNKLLKKMTKNPDNFDYVSGTNMSKTIYASIWLLSSFPAKIISSRDKNERKDRAIRDAGLFAMFFGGDFLLNNILGRLSDKFLNTKIMNTDKYANKNHNFFQKFKLSLRNFKTLDLKLIPDKAILNKTKNVGAVLYWVSLLTNTALIGFALPKFLNKFLRHNIAKENQENKSDLSVQQKSIIENYLKG